MQFQLNATQLKMGERPKHINKQRRYSDGK